MISLIKHTGNATNLHALDTGYGDVEEVCWQRLGRTSIEGRKPLS